MDVVDFHRRNGDVLKYIPPLLIEKKRASARQHSRLHGKV